MSLGEFFHMGGYAFHVWSTYGLTLVLLLAMVIMPINRKKQLVRKIRKAIRRSSQS